MRLRQIRELLDAVIVHQAIPEDTDLSWAIATDLMSEVLYYSKDNSLLITGLTRQQAIRTAHIADIRVVVFTKGKEPDFQTLELAKDKGVTLLITPHCTFSACGILYERGMRCCPDE